MTVGKLVVGDKFSGLLEIRDILYGTTRNGSPYCFVDAGDLTGEIKIKIWSLPEDLKEELDKNKRGFVEIKDLEVGEYQGKKEVASQAGQGVLVKSRDQVMEDDSIDLSDFSFAAPFKEGEMYDYILSILNKMENKDIEVLVRTILMENEAKFKIAPASTRVHHDFEGGLLFHTFNMLRVGEALKEFYPMINFDLLAAGIILHDMGKVFEYENEEGVYDFDFSMEGSLLGHISIMSGMVYSYGEKLDIDREVIVNIQHLILSHHGNLEWGSPVIPKTPEALMLHYIDNLDSKMEILRASMNGMEKGEFTGKLFGIGNTKAYLPNL